MVDVLRKNLATTIVKTETLASTLLMYIQEPRLQEVAAKLRSQIELLKAWNVIDKRALDAALDSIDASFCNSSNWM